MRYSKQVDPDSLSNTTYSKVTERLRNDILSNHFAPGTRLKILGLVKLYKVSQMPIREALQQLQGEGLVVIEQHKGAYVRQIDKKLVSNIYDVRRVIEVYLTLESLRNITDDVLRKLRKIQTGCEKAAKKGKLEQLLEFNTDFHGTLYKLADNEEAFRLVEGHWQLINSLRMTFGFGADRGLEIVKEHEGILIALEMRDKKALEEAANLHCLRAKEDALLQMYRMELATKE
ncbi:MAG: GntR family transcriptional regulator [Bacteroidota bacterium]